MVHAKSHAKKSAAKHPKKRPLAGAAKSSVDFAGGKEHGGWSVRLVKEGFGYAVHVKRNGRVYGRPVKGSKAHCDEAFVAAVAAAKG